MQNELLAISEPITKRVASAIGALFGAAKSENLADAWPRLT
jgi:hypothetical protein